MSILDISAPGRRAVRFDLDPKTALDVFFHLSASLHCEETTIASRIHIGGLLPQLRRALIHTGVISDRTLDQLTLAINSKPAPPALDQAVAALKLD